MRKERVVSALGRWESAKKKRGKKPSSNASRRVGGDNTCCAPTRLPRLFSRESPKRKRKMASESSAWGRLHPNARRRPPHRSLCRTTTLPEILSAFRDRGRIEPTIPASHFSKVIFSAYERKRPNTQTRAASARRFATGVRTLENGAPNPFASLLFFTPQKNVPFFSSSSALWWS